MFAKNKGQMAFAKPKDRFPTFLTGGFSWKTYPVSQIQQTETQKPTLQPTTYKQTSFLGYRSYIKHKKNAAQVSPTTQVCEESPSSLSPQTQ